MNELTNEELRLEIAKAKGWKNIFYYDGPDITTWMGLDPDQHYSGQFALPDWSTDIAAAFALEDEIPQISWMAYYKHLEYVVAHDSATIFTDTFDDEARMEVHHFQLIHATARQRSLAWLAWMEAKK
jgi:hypothetical protein